MHELGLAGGGFAYRQVLPRAAVRSYSSEISPRLPANQRALSRPPVCCACVHKLTGVR
jgi:hypothetical protein